MSEATAIEVISITATPVEVLPKRMELTGEHSGGVRAFYHFGRLYPNQYPEGDVVDEIAIGVYHPDEGTTGEFMIRWHDLGSYGISPRLEAFGDSWTVLVQIFPDFLNLLAEIGDQNITTQEMRDRLVEMGLEDWTW